MAKIMKLFCNIKIFDIKSRNVFLCLKIIIMKIKLKTTIQTCQHF